MEKSKKNNKRRGTFMTDSRLVAKQSACITPLFQLCTSFEYNSYARYDPRKVIS